MTRPLLALSLLALTATACDGDSSPPGDVTVYWGFVRNTMAGPVLYDAQDPGGSLTAACEQSGVEYVRVTRLDGRDVDPSIFVEGGAVGAIPCVFNGAHGATFKVISSGTHTWNVTGYRTFEGREIAVAQATTRFDVRPDRLTEVVVDVQPIQDDVVFNPIPWNQASTFESTCPAEGVVELDVFLWTFAGDQVVSQTVAGCAPLTFRLDRDDYEVRMRGFASSAATDPTHDTNFRPRCEAVFIPQLGPRADGSTSWLIDLFFVAAPGAVPCP